VLHFRFIFKQVLIVSLDTLKSHSPKSPTVPISPASPVVTSGRTASILIEIEEVQCKREAEEGRIRKEEKERSEIKRKQRTCLTQEEEERAQKNALEAEEAQLETNDIGRHRMRTKCGEKRDDSNKQTLSQQGQHAAFGSSSVNVAPVLGIGLGMVAPLEMSANCWVPTSPTREAQPDTDTPEMVDRKVKGLLNKLTMERFDSISDEIVDWMNKNVDGRTLIQFTRLVFEKAMDEAACSAMYARLCRKMMEQISLEVWDYEIKNTKGKPIAGSQLFRKYLLNRCQEDFERGWSAKEAAAAVTANGKKGTEETELYSDEYYAAQKAKRQCLGLIKFIGELFKLQMLTERIMHECVKKLLGNAENPEEEEIESLCQLLTTAGQLLDTPKARAHMDVYFTRMKELGKSTNVGLRMQFMLQVCNESWLLNHCTRSPL
jgi:translation initiation factor 4G